MFLTLSQMHGWNDPKEFLDFLGNACNLGLFQLSQSTVRGLVQIVNELNARNWPVEWFVDEATRSHNIVHWLTEYERGGISGEAAIRNIRALGE